MNKQKFNVITKGLITCNGEILIGKQKSNDSAENWILPEKHVEKEEIEKSFKNKIKEETSLNVEIHHLIDVHIPSESSEKDILHVLYHCEAQSKDAEASKDLEKVKWISPEEITSYVHNEEADRIKSRDKQSNFIQKLEKMPTF